MIHEYTLADAIVDDPFIGFCFAAAALILSWVVYEVVIKPWRFRRRQREIDAIKAEVRTVGHDVAEGKRLAAFDRRVVMFRTHNGHPVRPFLRPPTTNHQLTTKG